MDKKELKIMLHKKHNYKHNIVSDMAFEVAWRYSEDGNVETVEKRFVELMSA